MSHDAVIQLIRFLGERSGEGIVLFEQGGDVASMNATARRLLKLWRKEDSPLLPVVCERLGIRPSEVFSLEGGGVPWCADLFGKAVEIHLYGLPSRKGLSPCTLALLRDIEKEKEFEEARNEFLLLLGQELRNPIEALRGVVGNLKKGWLGEMSVQQREFLDVIELQMDGVADFVGNLLDFSSVLVRGYQHRRGPIEIHEVLRRVKLKVEGIARACGVRFVPKAAKDIPRFYGDDQSIFQGLAAISAAAVRLRAKGGSIELSATLDDPARAGNPIPGGSLLVCLRVGNIGLTKVSVEQVLAGPSALEMSAARECGGFGLALLVAKSVVLGHGGRIWTDGQKGLLQSVNLLIPMDLRQGREKDGSKPSAS